MTSYYKIIATDNLTFGESTDNLTLLEYKRKIEEYITNSVTDTNITQ